MSHNDIIRAWKDEEYRNSLSEEERAKLPENPAGDWEEIDEQMMEALAGGGGSGGLYPGPAPTKSDSSWCICK